MFCRNCGEKISQNQAICLKCGVKVGEGNSFCKNCGKEVSPEADVCLNCGVKLKGITMTSGNSDYLNGQDKIMMALVCFFLGGIGIHNFMLGEQKKGIVKIVGCFVCGISSILALVDFIKILTDKYVVDPDKMF